MKTTKLLITPLVLVLGLQAQPSDTTTEEISNVNTGTTVGHYSKPGAPINMSYTSNSVDHNETSEINITLTTSVQTGTMDVMLTLDDKLTQISDIEENLTFTITPEQREYKIKLQVSSSEDGLYYIRLLTKIDKGMGSQLRSFAVPVYIGVNPLPSTRSSSKIM